MILVSACLVGEKCRYDGKSSYNRKVAEYLKDKEYQTICPEMMGGLPCPRVPSERLGDCVKDQKGNDVTLQFQKGALKALALAEKLQPECIILQERSPSCGVHVIYDGNFSGNKISGQGVTAQLFKENGFHILSSADFE